MAMVPARRFRRHTRGPQGGPTGLRVRGLRARPATPARRFDARGGRRAVGPQHPAHRVPALHPRLVANHPGNAHARPRRSGAGRAVGFVRGRGAHRLHGRRRQVSDHPRRDAHRYGRHSRRDERHRTDRGDELVAVLGVRYDPGHDAGAARQRGGDILLTHPVLSIAVPGLPAGAAYHVRATLPVRTTMTTRIAWVLGVVLVGPALTGRATAAAQDSQYGIRGLGTPGRWESVRSRSTGGAFAPFDPLSPLTEAPLADVPQLTATAMESASYRDAEVSGTTSALRATRFPLLNDPGRVNRRLSVGAGFPPYLDRTWDVTLRDSTLLRGTLERYTDEVTSDGSIAHLRFAGARRLSRRIALGAGLHLLAGSTRETAERRFDDTTFHTVQQLAEVRYSGMGVSGSLLLGVAPGLSVIGWARADNRLRATAADTTSAETDLPRMAGGGRPVSPRPGAPLGGSMGSAAAGRAAAPAVVTSP